ncbi:helix-turn-helix domain-containing protein [Leptolyngbya sp. AN02str]|uniref:helix-turn-helix domain-containing protein n=1 Tax=Leptolyngbya sp. AN02str TaxID=3423363 RepID=UPI003D3100D0
MGYRQSPDSWFGGNSRDVGVGGMSVDKKAVAKRLYEQGRSYAAIALDVGVSTRTVERWGSEGNWAVLRQANVVPLERSESQPRQRPTPRSRRGDGAIDEMEIVEGAIANLAVLLDGSGDVDPRSLGGIAGALVRLLEYRRKVQPQTAAELAERAIALNINPAEFARELREKWQLRA